MKIELYGINKKGFTFSLLPTIIVNYEHRITDLGIVFFFWAMIIDFND